jgi:hypothetical protein
MYLVSPCSNPSRVQVFCNNMQVCTYLEVTYEALFGSSTYKKISVE